MKKILVVSVVLACMLGAVMSSYAALGVAVNVTTNNPTVTKAEGGCEKLGAMTFIFPEGAILTEGEFWYIDLPAELEICQNLDYFVINRVTDDATEVGPYGSPEPEASAYVSAYDVSDRTYAHFEAGTAAMGPALDGDYDDGTQGPLYTRKVDNTSLEDVGFVADGDVALRIKGVEGGNRVYVYIVGNDSGTTGTLTVNDGWEMYVKVFDGVANNFRDNMGDSDTVIIVDADDLEYEGTPTGITGVATDGDGDVVIFGLHDNATAPLTSTTLTEPEYIDVDALHPAFDAPFVENSLCVNAEDMVGTTVMTSVYYKDNFHTFTVDSFIGHTGSGDNLDLLICTSTGSKTDVASPQLDVADFTQSGCIINYTAGTNYCDAFTGGKVYLTADADADLGSRTGTFGEEGDSYNIGFLVTNGYWASTSAALYGATTDDNVCTDTTADLDSIAVTAWAAYTDSTLETQVTTFNTGDCDTQTAQKATALAGVNFTGLNDFTDMLIDLPSIVFDQGHVVDENEISVIMQLDKVPCGTIFIDGFTYGTFTTLCSSTSTGTSTVVFPAITGTDAAAAGWWASWVISNGSSSAGTVTQVMFVDVSGNKATAAPTTEVPGNGHATFTITTDDLTQLGTGTFDFSENYTITVTCGFSGGGGLVMLGNGTEGVGYTAYASDW